MLFEGCGLLHMARTEKALTEVRGGRVYALDVYMEEEGCAVKLETKLLQ